MELSLILLIAAGAWFWLDSIGARDKAVEHGRTLTERTQLQLLDETVYCSKIRLGRNSKGHVQLLRTYEFEASAHGSDRLACTLQMLGRDLQQWHIPPYLQVVH